LGLGRQVRAPASGLSPADRKSRLPLASRRLGARPAATGLPLRVGHRIGDEVGRLLRRMNIGWGASAEKFTSTHSASAVRTHRQHAKGNHRTRYLERGRET